MNEEYYHIGGDGEGEAGPFDTLEEAKADALQYLHERRWGIPVIKIVKVVETSTTKTEHITTWS